MSCPMLVTGMGDPSLKSIDEKGRQLKIICNLPVSDER